MKLLTLRNWRRCAWTQISALLSLFSFWGRLSNARSDLQRRLSFPVSVSPQFSHSSVLFSAWATTLINREWINQLLRIETLIRLIPLATVAYLRSFDRFRRKFTRYLEGFSKLQIIFLQFFFSKFVILVPVSWTLLIVCRLDLLVPLFFIGEELVDYGICS